MKKYLELAPNDAGSTHLKAEVIYNLGGYSYWTSRTEQRGYYLHVSPVKRETRDYNGRAVVLESFVAFSGYKQLVKPVTRKSAKAEAEAETLAEEALADLIRAVCSKNGLQLAAETATGETSAA